MKSESTTLGFRHRLREVSRRRGSKLILALDFFGPYDGRLDNAVRVLSETKEHLAAVKVNHHLLLPYGLQGMRGVISACKDEGLPLIADLKINDIESTNLNIVDSLLDYGFDSVIANPFVGREEGLGKVIERVHSKNAGILFLVYMSHKGAADGYSLRLEGGEPLYRLFAHRAREWGADGVVVSAKSADKIAETRQIVGEELLIFSPGVGAQGGNASAGISAGADFVFVGRSITESQEPSKTAAKLKS
ncbi:MAG: orotidine 5'-phosphate decarboxylase [Nitrososphaerota archaeon]|jgi:orotidine-5'-phosphate decarboxylase|nr:orotidine 5'-phosphate decarboxylase [Nitrososphaerota archaeon]